MWNDYLRKTSCQEQQPAQFANKNGSRTTRCKYVVWNKLLQKNELELQFIKICLENEIQNLQQKYDLSQLVS